MALIEVQKISNGELPRGGKAYFGIFGNEEPENNPIQVFTDFLLTQPLDLSISSVGVDLDRDGYTLVLGQRTDLYIAVDFSFMIRDSKGARFWQRARQITVVADEIIIDQIWDVIGVPQGSINMGPYDGDILDDDGSIKENIQQLETATEANSSFKTLDELRADITFLVGDVRQSSEYNTGSGVGAGLYEKVSVDPGNNLINPATSDGNWLLNLFDTEINIFQSGVTRDGITDYTENFAQAYDASSAMHIPSGTFKIDNLTLDKPYKIRTDGLSTILSQNSGVVGDVRIILIESSDVDVGDLTFEGNIATDTGEQKHGILVRNSTQDISRIKIGNIHGKDLRGDVVDISGLANGNPDGVTVGLITSDNIFRNALSITGGKNIDVIGVIGIKCGLFAVDIEPDTSGGIVRNIHIGSVWGKQMGIPNNNTADFGNNLNITIDNVYLDGDLPRSTPAISAQTNDLNGLIFRNANGVNIERCIVKNFDEEGIIGVFGGSDVPSDNISFGQLDISACCRVSGDHYFNGGAFTNVKFGLVNYVLDDPDTQRFFIGRSDGPLQTFYTADKITGNGPASRFCGFNISNADITYTEDQYLFRDTYFDSSVANLRGSVGRIAGLNTRNIEFRSCDLNYTGSFKYDGGLGTTWHAVETNCTDTGVWQAIRVDNVPMTQP